MFLGIEIGGTKLQVGVGKNDGKLIALERATVEPAAGAKGILAQIERMSAVVMQGRQITAAGVGFGGPVNPKTGVVVRSNRVEGWIDFPLAEWCDNTLRVPTFVENDADLAALAEATHGAGRGLSPVLYITVGTGIGGGLVIDGKLYRGAAGAVEIGHLRAGLHADRPDETVESIASGWGIGVAAQALLAEPVSRKLIPLPGETLSRDPDQVRQRLQEEEEAAEEYTADLYQRCDGEPERLTAKVVAQAAAEGNALAQEILSHAWQSLGWGIAQAITLFSPRAVVIGGGVSLIGETLFFEPVRAAAARYVFPPFAHSYEILPASLGEEMVIHGAIAAAGEKAAAR